MFHVIFKLDQMSYVGFSAVRVQTPAQPNVYSIKVDVIEESKSKFSQLNSQSSKKFSDEDRTSEPKIYLLTGCGPDATVLYVGQTVQPLQVRMYQGISNQSYKWARRAAKYDLLVWNLCGIVGSESSYDLDSIEAELTFLVRATQGEWPTYQTSINFRWSITNNIGYGARKIAEVMLTQFYDYLLDKKKNQRWDTTSIEQEKSNLEDVFKL